MQADYKIHGTARPIPVTSIDDENMNKIFELKFMPNTYLENQFDVWYFQW